MNSAIIEVGLLVIALYVIAVAKRRMREASEAQAAYDRRRAEAVLRALEASRDRA